MIEPAAYGVATCFGPNTQNFRDVVELLLSQQAAVRVNTGAELTNFLLHSLRNPSETAKLGSRAAEVVRQQQGATNRTWSPFEELLPKPTASVSASKNRSAA